VKPARLAELSLLGITSVWGLTFVVVQDAVEQMPVTAYLAYRFVAAALLLAVIFRKRLKLLTKAAFRQGLWMGVFLAAGYLFQTYGLEATSASNAGFITGLFVVITPLMAWALNRQSIGWVPWAAAGVSAFGLFLLSGGGNNFTFRGDGLELLCAIAFSAHIIATSRGVKAGHDVIALVVVQLTLVGVVCSGMAVAAGDLVMPHGAGLWANLALTSLITTALAFVVQTWAQKHAAPDRTALILAGEPAFAGLFGWWLAGDRLGLQGWLGAALIFGAILAVETIPRFRPQRPLPEG
jgi:drug/metabolite transporter (DMT)-like permease